jgi:hypothetical protein
MLTLKFSISNEGIARKSIRIGYRKNNVPKMNIEIESPDDNEKGSSFS